MANNMRREDSTQLSVVCTAPVTPNSGDPVLYGQRPGVALTDERSDGTTTVKFDGVFNLEVVAVDGGGNSAVVAGDVLYYNAGVINKNTNGVRFGYAGDGTGGTLIVAGNTAIIPVTVGY
jgi:predicted RecA/RadA family phage recombinase